MLIEESVLVRTAWAGWSSISITCLAGTNFSSGCESSSGCTRSGRPTTTTSTPSSLAACAAPSTASAGARSPPMPSTAIFKPSDIEIAHVLGVGLDELLARLHVRTHQLLEDVVDECGVLDLNLEQRARLGVHGRLPELVGVHLSQALEPVHLDLATHSLGLAVALHVAVDPLGLLALGHLVEGGLRHVDVAVLDQRGEVAVEERKQQGSDVGPVDVSVGHRYAAGVAQLLVLEALPDTGAQRGDQVADLL